VKNGGTIIFSRYFVKIQFFIPLFVAAALLCGCASSDKKSDVRFTDLHDSTVFVGKGGEQTVVDGVDFWVTGEPDRSYRILGLLDLGKGKRGHGHGHLFGGQAKVSDLGDPQGEIAKGAKENGGDAIVIEQQVQKASDSDEFGSGSPRTVTRYVLVKYVD
jgi:hypothetical protein